MLPEVPPHVPGPGQILGPGTVTGEPLEGELARFFGYSWDVLVVMDRGSRVHLVNPAVERVLGYSMERVLGRRLLRWVHPEDRAAAGDRLRHASGQGIAALDVRIRRAEGGWMPMRWSLTAQGRSRIYAVGRDRTEEVRHREERLKNEMAELRLRTAMELHDGILQTLTGATLQIAVARRLLMQDPSAADDVLAALGSTVAAEQQEMRLYVDEVKGKMPPWTDGTLDFAERIRNVLERVSRIWGVTTSLDAKPDLETAPEQARQILRIVQEATVNAARHGSATAVSVAAVRDAEDIALTITDNGRGFSFLGEYDTEALKEKRLGPLSLKHRVARTGGRISIKSTRGGSRVSVRIPAFPEVTP